MKEFSYRRLLFRELNILAGPWTVLDFALHHHIDAVESQNIHSHPYSQLLLFLHGSGFLQIGESRFSIHRGHVLFIPAGTSHCFDRIGTRAPITLVINFHWEDSRSKKESVARINSPMLSRIRQHLAGISRIEKFSPTDHSLLVGSKILECIDLLLQSCNCIEPFKAGSSTMLIDRVKKVLASHSDPFTPLWKIAQKIGYQQDHLNRLLQQNAGTTLGQLRDHLLLEKAKLILRSSSKVAEVSDMLGFHDSNYFSRWFRKMTGMTPKAFISTQAASRI